MDKLKAFLVQNPRVLFLLDANGAVLTTVLLYFVVRNNVEFFGAPSDLLTKLSLVGLSYFVYSFICFLLLRRNWAPFLRIIAVANLMYCVATATGIFVYFDKLTKFGVLYFAIEIVIIVAISLFELSVAKRF